MPDYQTNFLQKKVKFRNLNRTQRFRENFKIVSSDFSVWCRNRGSNDTFYFSKKFWTSFSNFLLIFLITRLNFIIYSVYLRKKFFSVISLIRSFLRKCEIFQVYFWHKKCTLSYYNFIVTLGKDGFVTVDSPSASRSGSVHYESNI